MTALAMTLVPSSPRTRRRLAWLLAGAAVAAAVAAAIVLLPSRTPARPPTAAGAAEPAGAAAKPTPPQRHVPLRSADRAEIRRLLNVFIPAAVERRDPAAAYDLATANLRSGMTRTEWATGTIPVYPFRTRRGSFDDGWRINYSFPGQVSFDLVLPPPKGAKQGPLAFTVDLERHHGRWLVDSFVPVATFAPLGATPRITAHPDFAPATTAVSNRSRLGALWLAIPLALLGSIVMTPLVLFLVSWRRERRALAAYHAHLRG